MMPVSHIQPRQTSSVTVIKRMQNWSEQGGQCRQVDLYSILERLKVVSVARWPLFTGGLYPEVIYISFPDGKILKWSL